MTLPEIELASIAPTTNGSIRSPAVVALAPSTICRYSGRKVTVPNIATPTRNPLRPADQNGRAANSDKGSTGSVARRSCATNALAATIATAPKATIVGESHAYCDPPHEDTS